MLDLVRRQSRFGVLGDRDATVCMPTEPRSPTTASHSTSGGREPSERSASRRCRSGGTGIDPVAGQPDALRTGDAAAWRRRDLPVVSGAAVTPSASRCSGKLVRWYLACTDIDDRKRAEERLQQENGRCGRRSRKTSMFEEIVGSSPALLAVLSRVSKVATSDSTVLLTGETGTGKELVARAIHRRSRRASRAFVAVNCAAIPRELIASGTVWSRKGRAHRRHPAARRSLRAGRWWNALARRGGGPVTGEPGAACAGESCRNRRSSGLAGRTRSRWTCGSSPRRIAI